MFAVSLACFVAARERGDSNTFNVIASTHQSADTACEYKGWRVNTNIWISVQGVHKDSNI
jgi:hypothetical protein